MRPSSRPFSARALQRPALAAAGSWPACGRAVGCSSSHVLCCPGCAVMRGAALLASMIDACWATGCAATTHQLEDGDLQAPSAWSKRGRPAGALVCAVHSPSPSASPSTAGARADAVKRAVGGEHGPSQQANDAGTSSSIAACGASGGPARPAKLNCANSRLESGELVVRMPSPSSSSSSSWRVRALASSPRPSPNDQCRRA